MVDITRELAAYGIITTIVVVMIPVTIKMRIKRHRQRLRRQGIKRYGH